MEASHALDQHIEVRKYLMPSSGYFKINVLSIWCTIFIGWFLLVIARGVPALKKMNE